MRTFLCALICFAYIAGAAASDALKVCPKPLEDGGERKDSAYHFSYKSWMWPTDNGGYVFCSCVRNTPTGRAVYVKWDGANLEGFVPADDAIYSYDTYPDSTHDIPKKPIWYGPSLKRIETPTVIPRLKQHAFYGSESTTVAHSFSETQLSQYQPTLWLAGGDKASPPKPNPLQASMSGSIFLPAELGDDLSKESLISFVEEHPEVLTAFTMKFESEAIRNDTGQINEIQYECSYDSRLDRRSRLSMRITDPRIHEVLFRSTRPVQLGNWKGLAGSTFRGGIHELNLAEKELRTKTAAMEILAPDGETVIGALHIRYFDAN